MLGKGVTQKFWNINKPTFLTQFLLSLPWFATATIRIPISKLKMSIDFPKEEEKVLQRWKEVKAFERQLELSEGKKRYTFYDGPPFATGLPHYGHLLASTIKDIIPRYWSMKGFNVERRFGWDTHGIPIEYEIEKKLGISGKDAVMKFGLAKYNEECRAIVMRFSTEWRTTIERLGRWIDFDNDYKESLPQTQIEN
jgi:isoleucyl-tRNA synthetase